MPSQKLELDREYPPPDEPADIQDMVELIKFIHHPQADGRVLRVQHAKDTGCVKLRFIVDPNLPDECRFGVFKESRTFDVVVRFSNSSEFVEKDSAGSARGMAVKLLDVEGERAIDGDSGLSQDFLLVDRPAFVFRAVKDYTALFALRRRLKNTGCAPGRLRVVLPPPGIGRPVDQALPQDPGFAPPTILEHVAVPDGPKGR